jgi:hypothetical protein
MHVAVCVHYLHRMLKMIHNGEVMNILHLENMDFYELLNVEYTLLVAWNIYVSFSICMLKVWIL